MYSKFSDFPSTYWDSLNKILTYYVKLSDRTVSILYCDGYYTICMNNINYDISFDNTEHALYAYVGWDATLLLDRSVEDFDLAMTIVNKYVSMKKIPYVHPEYKDPMAI